MMDVAQLCEWLGIARRTAYRLVAEGLPHFRLGSGPRAHLRFQKPAVLAWLEQLNAPVETRRQSRRAPLVVEGLIR